MDRIYVARFAPSHASSVHVVLNARADGCVLDVRVIQHHERPSVLQQLALHKKSKDPVFLPAVAVMETINIPSDDVKAVLDELAGMDRKELLIGSSQSMEGMTLTGEIHEQGLAHKFQAWAPLTGLPLHVRFFSGLHDLAAKFVKDPVSSEALAAAKIY